MNGNVCEVGGINLKIEGAIKAGVNLVLIPKDNEDDYNKYLKKQEDDLSSSDENINLLPNKIEVRLVSRIEEIIDIIFIKKIKYKKIY